MPTVFAVPLFRQFLFLDALDMKPLSLAVGVLTHDHLPIGRTAAITILRLVRIVFPLATLQTLSRGFFTTLLLEASIILEVFIQTALLQLLLQFLCRLMNQVVQLLRNAYLFLRLALHLILHLHDLLELLLHLLPHLWHLLLTPTVQPLQKGLARRLKAQLQLLNFFVQFANLPQEGVSLRRNHVKSVYKIIHIAHVSMPKS